MRLSMASREPITIGAVTSVAPMPERPLRNRRERRPAPPIPQADGAADTPSRDRSLPVPISGALSTVAGAHGSGGAGAAEVRRIGEYVVGRKIGERVIGRCTSRRTPNSAARSRSRR